jgi:excinuclease ABC subunit C
MVKDSIAFLEGRGKSMLADLSSRMKTAASHMNFEEAAVLRDRIAAIDLTLEKQRIVSAKFKDQDVFGLYRKGNQTQVLVLQIRKGKLLGKKVFPIINLSAVSEEIISSLVIQYYDGNTDLPAEIILPLKLEDGPVISEWLTEKRGKAVALTTPRKGPSLDLSIMAHSNAENMFNTELLRDKNTEAAILQLKEKLGLKSAPRRIECFDISNVSGKHAVGSSVAFVDGKPWKDGYRRFRIRTVTDMDDYRMMREVLLRRYKEKKNLPDLVVVDGGKGQLGVAVALFRDLGIDTVDIVGLAKEKRTSQTAGIKKEEDRVYIPHRKEPVYISRWPPVHFLLQQVRDEAHRFALIYHHTLKEKKDFHSILDNVPGLGNAKKKALLAHFGDIKKIEAASPEELRNVKGVGKHLGELIHAYLRSKAV